MLCVTEFDGLRSLIGKARAGGGFWLAFVSVKREQGGHFFACLLVLPITLEPGGNHLRGQSERGLRVITGVWIGAVTRRCRVSTRACRKWIEYRRRRTGCGKLIMMIKAFIQNANLD